MHVTWMIRRYIHGRKSETSDMSPVHLDEVADRLDQAFANLNADQVRTIGTEQP